MATDIDDINIYIENHMDLGCEAATDFLRRRGELSAQSECRACPFAECLDDLDASDRRCLKRHDSMINVYRLRDEGHSVNAISDILDVPKTNINRWLADRHRFEKRLYKLVDMIQYIGSNRSNARI